MDGNQTSQRSRLDASLDQFDFPVRTANCLKAANISTIKELAALRSTDILKWPQAGKKTLNSIRTFLGLFELKLADDLYSVPNEQGKAASSPTCLEDELLSIASPLDREKRNVEILIKLWGWGGEPPRTLDSVGKDYGLTRERVRQIESRALKRLKKHPIDCPFLKSAIDQLKKATPGIGLSPSQVLIDNGIANILLSVEGLQVAATNLQVKWPFEFLSVGKIQMLCLRGEAKKFRTAIILLRKKTSERGCTNIETLRTEASIEEHQLQGLRHILELAGGLEWLDDAQDWLYLSESPRNRLFNICSKVLGAASKIHLSELRRAVSKSRRLAMCPPQRILATFVEKTGLGRINDSMVYANLGCVSPPREDSTEGIMLRVLAEHGPIMDRDILAERCIDAGINPTTFYIYLIISPVINVLGKGVYCPVGTNVPPGKVEEIAAKRKSIRRFFDHGWTPTGRLWCGVELTRQVITSGGIRVTSFVTDFVQGEWQVELPDGTNYGAVTCRELFIWSFRKQFALLGAEPTDLAVFEFDLKVRKVIVRVGGPGLLEEMQEDGVPSDEDIDDS